MYGFKINLYYYQHIILVINKFNNIYIYIYIYKIFRRYAYCKL